MGPCRQGTGADIVASILSPTEVPVESEHPPEHPFRTCRGTLSEFPKVTAIINASKMDATRFGERCSTRTGCSVTRFATLQGALQGAIAQLRAGENPHGLPD